MRERGAAPRARPRAVVARVSGPSRARSGRLAEREAVLVQVYSPRGSPRQRVAVAVRRQRVAGCDLNAATTPGLAGADATRG